MTGVKVGRIGRNFAKVRSKVSRMFWNLSQCCKNQESIENCVFVINSRAEIFFILHFVFLLCDLRSSISLANDP